MNISLRVIDATNYEECIRLGVGVTQLGNIVPNVYSLAELAVRPEARAYGVYQGDNMIGFVMIIENQETHEYDIHRFMIDFRYQWKWYGTRALQEIIELIKGFPDRPHRISIMFLVENTYAENLYKKVGFIDSGKTLYNEKHRYTEKIFYYTL